MKNPYNYVTKLEVSQSTDAKESLKKAYIELLKDRDYSEITVKELSSTAHVARSTFYAYYNNVNDVLEEIENTIIFDLLKLNFDIISGQDDVENLKLFEASFSYIKANETVFYNLLIKRPDYHFIDKFKDAIKYDLWEKIFKYRSNGDDALILDIMATVTITLYSYMLKSPYKPDIKKMLKVRTDILKLLDSDD